MPIEAGQLLLHYRLIEKIGEGGMGVVWRAEDTQLGRVVALKFLSESFAAEGERMARFEREAKLLASLNHSNIATIHGIEGDEGHRFIVLEYVEGDDLAARLRSGQLSVAEAVTICRQLTDALDAAHERGVLHRDLKPANIKVTPDGSVKVLDFGLAKTWETDPGSGDIAESPTITHAMTQTGVILGTAAYMSPEQARGRTTDKRTDIWSFGCILFELLAGRTAFSGETVSDYIAGILKGEPEWALLPAATPPRLKELMARCFEKDRRRRLRDIGDARIELEKVEAGDVGTAKDGAGGRAGLPLWTAAVLGPLLIAVGVGLASMFRSPAPDAPEIHLAMPLPDHVVDSRELRQAGFDEIRRKIREDDPHRPSTRITTLGDASTTSARNRQTDPAGLAKQLRGDLDWITIKGLEKDQARRYGSATELAADIRRHLQHEPVSAGPPSTVYHFRKFVRRHRVGVAAGIAVALALVLGFGAATVGLVRAVQAEELTRQEAERANREAETARQVSDFMIGLFEVSDPSEARGNTISVREVLDRGAEEIETTMGSSPEVQARMMVAMGHVYRNLGLYAEARPLFLGALETRRSELGADHPDTLESVRAMGFLLQSEGKLDEAEIHYREALEGRRRLLGDEDVKTLEVINDKGVLFQMRGEFQEAEAYFREALEGRRRMLGAGHAETMSSYTNMALNLTAQGRADEAEVYQREALEVNRQTLGDDHPETLKSINNLGFTLLAQGKLEETEPLYREALDGRRRVLGDDHPETLISFNNMGFLLASQDKLAEAEPFYREALEGNRRVLGNDHPDVLLSIGNLGDLYTSQGKFDEALELLSEAEAGVRRVLPREHVLTGFTIRKYGRCLTGLRRYDEAETALLEAHEILVAAVGADHPQTAKVKVNLAELYEAWGQPDRAAEWRNP